MLCLFFVAAWTVTSVPDATKTLLFMFVPALMSMLKPSSVKFITIRYLKAETHDATDRCDRLLQQVALGYLQRRSTRDIIEILFKLIVKVPVVGSIVVSAVLPTTGTLTINLNSISICGVIITRHHYHNW